MSLFHVEALFSSHLKELMVECTKSWQPNKLCVVWTRRSRRKTTELLSWQPTIQNPYRGLVVWPVPENVDITVTLFQDPKATDYEDKVRTIKAKSCWLGRRLSVLLVA